MQVLRLNLVGMYERDVKDVLNKEFASRGADEALAFDHIVASGPNAVNIHYAGDGRQIQDGDLVEMDIGAMYQGYASDITRTIVLGKATEKQKKIYGIVLTAQKAACKAVRPNAACSDVDGIARDIIAKAGYSDNFGHGLGHGIGLLVHDGPGLGPRSTDILKPGNVVTIEPGIYIHNWGGVRIEDDVLVTANGNQILTRLPKELMEL